MIQDWEFIKQRDKASNLLKEYKSKINRSKLEGKTCTADLNGTIYTTTSWTGTQEQFYEYVTNKYINRDDT